MGSISGQIMLKFQRMLLDTSFLTTKNYKIWIKCKWSNLGKGAAFSLTPIEQ